MNITMTYKGHNPKDFKDLQVTQYNYNQITTPDSSWSYNYDQDYWSAVDEINEEAAVRKLKRETAKAERKAAMDKIHQAIAAATTTKTGEGQTPKTGGIPKSARKLTKKTKKSAAPMTATTKLKSQATRKRKSMI